MRKEDQLEEFDERENKDRNHNGIDDAIEPPPVDIAAGSRLMHDKLENTASEEGMKITAGDVDANFTQAEFSGDESAVSSMSTPGQSVVDEIGAAMGVTYQDDEELRVGDKERDRDRKRWELDPASSEDYKDRLRDEQ
jgi:hypothetical protein